MREGTPLPGHGLLYFRAWPLIWGTVVTTVVAVVLALVISTLAAVFLTEFAPAPARRALEPVVRLLAGVPSVIYGLIGILALAPWINNHLISNGRKQSVIYVVQLNGAEPHYRLADPDGDDPANHDRPHRQRPGGRSGLLAGGFGGAGRQPLAYDLAGLSANRLARDRGRDGSCDRAGARRGRDARDGRRRNRVLAPTRSTG